jgi:hypothetical protein
MVAVLGRQIMGTDFDVFADMIKEGMIDAGVSLQKDFGQATTSYFSAPEPGREGIVNDLVAGMFGAPKGLGGGR